MCKLLKKLHIIVAHCYVFLLYWILLISFSLTFQSTILTKNYFTKPNFNTKIPYNYFKINGGACNYQKSQGILPNLVRDIGKPVANQGIFYQNYWSPQVGRFWVGLSGGECGWVKYLTIMLVI